MFRHRAILAFLGVLLALLASGCATVRYEDYSKLGNPKKEEFVIGVADVIKIAVWKMPEVNTDVKVRPDGNVTVPLIGEVRAAGRTAAQLASEIQSRLKAFVKDDSATVTVAVTEVNSYVVTVSGKVARPGVFHLKEYVTVSDAMALAGGPTIYAAVDDVVIVRTWKTTNRPKRIPIQYSKIQEGLAPEQDLVLYTGDTIFVP